MKKLTFLLLLICNSAWAQQSATNNKYSFNDFMLIEKVEDQEKQYNKMLKELSPEMATSAATNDFRAELAFGWLAKGNIERYKYYKATNPTFSARQFIYLCNALEKLFDEKKQYAAVEAISRELLDDLKCQKLSEVLSRTPVLLELNAASNAKLGNIDIALKLIAESSMEKGSSARDMKYFKDMKSNYLNRYAIVMSAAGRYQAAFDTLNKAFKEAESNPYMVSTFKEVYKKLKGTKKGCEHYLQSLQDEAYQKYYKEVEKIYISSPKRTLDGTIPDPNDSGKMFTLFRAEKPVYDIALQDLEGKLVNLDHYKGKILALDFWSTLCTPCVAAFSGFERVVADYEKNEFQMFVVNLFEGQPTVKAYIAQKGISLDVLRDEENTAYGIQGTPTKIIFDPMGNIRFYAVGYAGSTDREYYKLKAMVEIVKARASN